MTERENHSFFLKEAELQLKLAQDFDIVIGPEIHQSGRIEITEGDESEITFTETLKNIFNDKQLKKIQELVEGRGFSLVDSDSDINFYTIGDQVGVLAQDLYMTKVK